ncbi:MAG: adenosylcobinamide-GDP ribazoletransferase [Rhodospirillales bacterium]|nr:adenosylcobinamide-GDP ribazoletransferase [Rhodospirillales bacterium]
MSVPRHNPIKDLAAAFILLTRIPFPWKRVSDVPPDTVASVWAFPVVGIAVGLGGAGVFAAASFVGLPSLVAAFLAIGLMVLMTGGLHEDGLADVADGFGGGGTVERKLEIMRDSRIGAYGMMATIIALGLRASGLAALGGAQAAIALVVAGMMSRLMMTFVMRYLQPARRDGLAHDAGKPALPRILLGLALTLIVAIWLTGPVVSLYAIGLASLSCLIMAAIAKRQIGGMTGDVLGAVQQVTDIAVLLLFVAL